MNDWFRFSSWLFRRGDKFKCRRCNYPITKDTTECCFDSAPEIKYHMCPNCGQPIKW